MTTAQISDRVYEERDRFKQDSDRAVHELADSLTPIYYSDIIAEWAELPSEFCDRWQELGRGDDDTITSLMTTDLFLYYRAQVEKAWDNCEYCDCELPKGVTISPSGTMASCDFCDYRCGHWEHACELEHDCPESTETN
jgi:hypothetical protein